MCRTSETLPAVQINGYDADLSVNTKEFINKFHGFVG